MQSLLMQISGCLQERVKNLFLKRRFQYSGMEQRQCTVCGLHGDSLCQFCRRSTSIPRDASGSPPQKKRRLAGYSVAASDSLHREGKPFKNVGDRKPISHMLLEYEHGNPLIKGKIRLLEVCELL